MENLNEDILTEGKEITESEVQSKLDYLRKAYESRKLELEDDDFWDSMSKGTKLSYTAKLKTLESEIARLERKLNKLKKHEPVSDDVDIVLGDSNTINVVVVNPEIEQGDTLQHPMNDTSEQQLTSQISNLFNQLDNAPESGEIELEDILIDPDSIHKTKEEKNRESKVYLKDLEESIGDELNPLDVEDFVLNYYKNNIIEQDPGVIRIKQFGDVFDIVYGKGFFNVTPLYKDTLVDDKRSEDLALEIKNKIITLLKPINNDDIELKEEIKESPKKRSWRVLWLKFCMKHKLNPLMATFQDGQEDLEKEWVDIFTKNMRKGQVTQNK
jgi:hypothetical protein